MTAEEQLEPNVRKAARWRALLRMRRGARVLFAIGALLLIVLIALWVQRRPIAAGFLDRELARHGVPARYRVVEIGFATQRIEDVVIGDPARPDLVADWVEVDTDVGLGGASVVGIRAGRVRARGRVVGGQVSLGAIDRLLPPPSGKPFTLPSIAASLADGRVRLETPQGLIGISASGQGRLDDGFRGRIAAVAPALSVGGCALAQVSGAFAIAIDERQSSLSGPLRARRLDCADASAGAMRADVAVALAEALDQWAGRAALTLDRLDAAGVALRTLAGRIDFDGTAAGTAGALDIDVGTLRAEAGSGEEVDVRGRYRIGEGVRFAGRAGIGRARLDAGTLAALDRPMRVAAGTPASRLAGRLADALVATGREARVSAGLTIEVQGGRGALLLRDAALEGANGARVALAGGEGVRVGWPDVTFGVDSTVTLSGGGLPEGEVRLAQASARAPMIGVARFAPYRAGADVLALGPLRFSRAADGRTRIETRIDLSTDFAGGRVERLTLPIDAQWDGGAGLVVNRGCVPASFARLTVSSLALDATRLRLCASDGAMLATSAARLRCGVAVDRPRLAGAIGGTPLALAADRFALSLADLSFGGSTIAARLGSPERLSRLDLAELSGVVADGAASGRFAGAAGAIANVPILMSEGAGTWTFADGRLALDGSALRVADAGEPARYFPLAADDFMLTLADNRVDARGTLATPDKGVKVANVGITHDLASGRGRADLAVPGIVFGEELQPDMLTRLTLGVIAEVEGTLSGTGQIRWNPEGVASDGVFRTAGTNLAAAFGPVEGISGEIRFSDLLGLRTEPGQVATIATVNPGIPVENGQVRYRLIGDQRVAVEGGRWPFAGGALTLEPTVLDFGKDVERRMTFRVERVDAAQFLQQFEFENLNATGTFDGVLPMVFDQRGGRIENGRLKVREGGGTIAYVGEVTQEDVGVWGNLAFQALRSLRYESLDLGLNGPLSGEMVTEIRFAGVSQGAGAKRNFIIDRLARLPFVFNVTIRAPFRQLLDSVQSYYDPTRLIERNLPTLLEQQRGLSPPPKTGVQPPDSETMP